MKKKWIRLLMVIMILALAFTGCGGNGDEKDNGADKDDGKAEVVEINVSAAASLTDALNEIIAEYSKERADIITPNYGGSGTLVQQIEEGAPCDLFISASKKNMDQLQDGGLIDEATRSDLLGNTLTLIASAEAAADVTLDNLADNGKITHIALGEPETVPAGKYASQVFDSLGITENVTPKIVYAKDVRAVLDYVDSGNAECGFVYKTDALLLESGKIVEDVSSEHHDPIVYPAALIADSQKVETAAAFLEFLKSDYSKGVFEKYGFTVL